jgi:hypothetical protein
MNKKEVLDAISQEFRKSLQDIGVTNGDVIKMMFPDMEQPHFYGMKRYMYDTTWWNAPYKEVKR